VSESCETESQRRHRTRHVEKRVFSPGVMSMTSNLRSASIVERRSDLDLRERQPQERIPLFKCVKLRLRTSVPQSQRKTVGRTLVHVSM
jgi:hypothetical protein